MIDRSKYPLLSDADLAALGEAVRSGTQRMDARAPRGWAREISGERLDMKMGDRCVAGQTWGDWRSGLKYLGLREDEAAAWGFVIPHTLGDSLVDEHWYQRRRQAWGALTDLWLDEIDARVREA